MFRSRTRSALVAIAFAGLILAGCGEANTSAGGGGEGLSGSIAVDGSSTVFPIARR